MLGIGVLGVLGFQVAAWFGTLLLAWHLWKRRQLVLAVCALMATPLVAVGAFQLTGTEAAAWLFYPEDTQYASGYSESAFISIAAGASTATVLSSLGRPLEVRDNIWYYSRPGPRFENFLVRGVALDTRGERVTAVIRNFYTE